MGGFDRLVRSMANVLVLLASSGCCSGIALRTFVGMLAGIMMMTEIAGGRIVEAAARAA